MSNFHAIPRKLGYHNNFSKLNDAVCISPQPKISRNVVDDFKATMQNVAEFSTQVNAQSGDIPEITRSLKEALVSVKMVMNDLSQTAPQLPRIVKNVGDTTDTLPVLVLQVQQVLVELERLIKQLQTSWLLGGTSRKDSQTAGRLSPLEVRP